MWTTVPTSPAFNPSRGTSSVSTTRSCSLIITGLLKDSCDQPGCNLSAIKLPDGSYARLPSIRRSNFSLDNVVGPEPGFCHPNHIVVATMFQAMLQPVLPILLFEIRNGRKRQLWSRQPDDQR